MHSIPENFYPITITGIRQETSDVKTFTLSEDIVYKAGQFITIVRPGFTERRSYSFSSSPDTDKLAPITIKRIDNGLMSRYLFDHVQPGDTLYATGPSGFFTIPGDIQNYEQVFFMAAGIGITPVISLIKTLLLQNNHTRIVLFYSNRSITTTIFYNELLQLLRTYGPRFKAEFLFSTSRDLARARLSKELVPLLLNEYLHTKEKALFYACGPFPYMRMILLALEEEQVPVANIKKENFSTSVITQKLVPPDTAAHTVYILYKGAASHLEVQYPDTILSAAQKQGLALPYSCENGICGTCAAKCIAGRIWHRNNEVLTDKELAAGMILTCIGYPIDGDAQLEIK